MYSAGTSNSAPDSTCTWAKQHLQQHIIWMAQLSGTYTDNVSKYFYTSSNTLMLPAQFWQISLENLLIALFKLLNTGAFMVCAVIYIRKIFIELC